MNATTLKEPDVDMFPGSHEENIKHGLGSYLDEFLSAIKIFGYLERPVFHELTRSMQTRKLIAGETLNLEDEQGFCIVVDGLVDIFVKSGPRRSVGDTSVDSLYDSSGEDDDYTGHGQQRYQLLTEVRNGAPMSSLFSIMSLFTEDVSLRVPEDELSGGTPSSTTVPQESFSETPNLAAPSPSASNTSTRPASREFPVRDGENGRFEHHSGITESPTRHITLDDGRTHPPIRPALKRRLASTSAHPDVIARATVDTTIAIIPASAFRRLIKTYPKATAQIVHLILTRFLRVTLATAYSYLGLTEEVLHTEKSVVRYTMCQLPNPLRGEPLNRLKQKFKRERERIGEDDQDKGIALHNSAARQRPNPRSNAFGFMGPLDASADGETESMASTNVPLGPPPNAHALALDLNHEVEIVYFPKGSVLIEQGERNPGLYYVIDGFLDICTSYDEGSIDMFAGPHGRALIKPGGLAGYIGSVSSYRSFIDVVAKTDVYVGFLPRVPLERIVDKYPIALLTMAKRLTNILPRLILHIDFALEWVQVNAGEVLFRKDDESEAIYLVLNGRLRLVEDKKEGGVKVRDEYGQGESVGELEVLTESTRPGTLHAIRDAELVKFPRTLFNSLAQEHPNITIKISKIIASRMRSLFDDPSKFILKDGGLAGAATFKGSSTVNLRTVAILPVTSGVPVVEFGNRLMNALAQVGPPNGATSLNQAAILSHLGRHAFNRMGKLKLSQYLADLEEKYSLVLYVADTNVNSPWTQTCISQADSILVVGLAEGSPEIGEYERFMLGMKSTARKSLVLLHSERFSPQGLTRAWLRNRVWINGGHYHVQMSYRLNTVPEHAPVKRLGKVIKERVQILQAEIQKYTSKKVLHGPFYSPEAPFKGDFHRLARKLCGKSVGLVLGGGGARGIAQIGIIRAMEEAGIPIDVIGGTSIGAFIGALYARHADVVPIFGLAKKFAGRMASLWRMALDLTYPSVSYTTGHEFNRGIFKTFGNAQMEDFWLEYYCNTTNISKSRSEIHTSGYAWRYIRASMSLAGLLPPLCDEGSMLLDGGYIDNLTVSHMKTLGADTIFAVDVGSLDDDTPQKFGDSLGNMGDARMLLHATPIDPYGTLDFGKFDEIYQTGYKYGKEYLQKLREEGRLPLVEETEAKKALRRTMAPRRASI
ncbi:unnamed protein product [Parascedosporium putredinis]|uniref:Lysophospholipase NTE1 n=1 Tax=Parascedosporium putredinis TaxID=1442378 RepID=A0A9P1GV67_9PEZI|nr:unnamed protein product [Parascedosporium putredinis]CAI7987713.1 unnamed protein product [Parascedosporium putredinis]